LGHIAAGPSRGARGCGGTGAGHMRQHGNDDATRFLGEDGAARVGARQNAGAGGLAGVGGPGEGVARPLGHTAAGLSRGAQGCGGTSAGHMHQHGSDDAMRLLMRGVDARVGAQQKAGAGGHAGVDGSGGGVARLLGHTAAGPSRGAGGCEGTGAGQVHQHGDDGATRHPVGDGTAHVDAQQNAGAGGRAGVGGFDEGAAHRGPRHRRKSPMRFTGVVPQDTLQSISGLVADDDDSVSGQTSPVHSPSASKGDHVGRGSWDETLDGRTSYGLLACLNPSNDQCSTITAVSTLINNRILVGQGVRTETLSVFIDSTSTFRISKPNPLLPDNIWEDPRDSDVVSLMIAVAERAGLLQHIELRVTADLVCPTPRVAKVKTAQA
jgi:hypothetical protein